MNLAGGEFGPSGNTYNVHYTYPTEAEINYFSSKRMNCVRVPFKQVRVIGSERDLADLERLVRHARSKNVSVVLDAHDYGRTASGKMIGRDAAANEEFAAAWSALATRFRGEPNVIFGIMNEPHEQSAAEWLSGANAAISAIRAAGATQLILVPGSYWDGAHSWVSSDNDTVMLGVQDPQNNFVYEVHQYLDHDSSGTNIAVVKGAGSTRLVSATEWARANGKKFFLGEFAFASDPAAMAEGEALIDYMHANRDVWIGSTYWAAGPWWGHSYFGSVEPANGQDKPQMRVLTKYL